MVGMVRAELDLAESCEAHVVKPIHGIGAEALAELGLGGVLHDFPKQLAGMMCHQGEEEEDHDTKPATHSHREGKAQHAHTHQAVRAIED